MAKQNTVYKDLNNQPVVSIIKGIDKDVEHGEDILMLGYCSVLIAPIFAPIAPPFILLPLMALIFVISVCMARFNFIQIQKKLVRTIAFYQDHDFSILKPIHTVFAEYPKHTLTEGFNPLKNLKRTFNSTIGGLLINPFWMPIFYMLGLQITEEKQLHLLNLAVIELEKRIAYW